MPAALSLLSQLHADKCWLDASLGGAQEARALSRELEAEGVSTRYWKVPVWVLHAGEWGQAFSLCSMIAPLSFFFSLLGD